MSKPQSAPYIIYIRLVIFYIYIYIKITSQRQRDSHNTEADVGFERHCPLLVKPTANNLLIQQQRQTVTQDHQHIEDDEIQLINIMQFRLSKYKNGHRKGLYGLIVTFAIFQDCSKHSPTVQQSGMR